MSFLTLFSCIMVGHIPMTTAERIHFYLLSPKCGLATEVDVDGVHPLTEARPQGSGFRKDHMAFMRQSRLKKRNVRSERGMHFYSSMNAKKTKKAEAEEAEEAKL